MNLNCVMLMCLVTCQIFQFVNLYQCDGNPTGLPDPLSIQRVFSCVFSTTTLRHVGLSRTDPGFEWLRTRQGWGVGPSPLRASSVSTPQRNCFEFSSENARRTGAGLIFRLGEQKLNDFSVGEAKIGERQSNSKYNFIQYVFFEKGIRSVQWGLG